MQIVKPSIEVTFHIPEGYDRPEKFLEKVGRTCYKSEDRITKDSANRFIEMLNKRGHLAMLEHCVASARLVCNRGLTHELVRHRLASYAQESTRYCNYSKEKHGASIGVIMPPFVTTDGRAEVEWRKAMLDAERHYFNLLAIGEPPQIARGVLPIDVKTEIVITANLREWQHIFKLRCAETAHPQIRKLMLKALEEFADRIPTMFLGLWVKYEEE